MQWKALNQYTLRDKSCEFFQIIIKFFFFFFPYSFYMIFYIPWCPFMIYRNGEIALLDRQGSLVVAPLRRHNNTLIRSTPQLSMMQNEIFQKYEIRKLPIYSVIPYRTYSSRVESKLISVADDDWNWNNRHRLFYNIQCRRIYRAQCTLI